MNRSRAGLALILGIGGGLCLAGSTLAAWVRLVTVDEVAGVPLESQSVTLGTELAGAALPIGLAAALLAFGLVLRRPRLRRVLGAALLLLGVAGLVVVGRGIAAATAEEGDMAAAPVVAAVAAAAVTAAGVEALLRRAAQPAPALPPRYELEGDDEDEEWRIASGEDPPEV